MEANVKDLMRLHELRVEMWRVFVKISETPKDDPEIEKYVDLMDEHQAVIAKMGRDI
jgi:hypothetical protein